MIRRGKSMVWSFKGQVSKSQARRTELRLPKAGAITFSGSDAPTIVPALEKGFPCAG
jgi:hypothetical protein